MKCVINKDKRIIDYFRIKKDKKYSKYLILKSSGILIFKKKSLSNFQNLKVKNKEIKHKIEQFRFLENDLKIGSIFIKNILPSINNKFEYNKIIKSVNSNSKQMKIVNQVLNQR